MKMTVQTVRAFLASIPGELVLQFRDTGDQFFNIDKLEVTQLSADDPIEVILSGEPV
jgi:hypothetical protein